KPRPRRPPSKTCCERRGRSVSRSLLRSGRGRNTERLRRLACGARWRRADRGDTRLGIDQEVAGRDDHLSGSESGDDLDKVFPLQARLDLPRREHSGRLLDEDDLTLAGRDERGARDGEHFSWPALQGDAYEHSRLQESLRIGEHDSHLERSRVLRERGIDKVPPPGEGP